MGYIMEMRALVGARPFIVVGACVFVFKEASILLMRRSDNGLWGLPGGSLEPGETLEECARRELLEETGLRASALEFFHVFSGPEQHYIYPNGHEAHIVTSAFVAREFNGDPHSADGESLELQFFHLRDLPAEMSPPTNPVLRKLLQSELAKTLLSTF